jgi:hypothetical protein
MMSDATTANSYHDAIELGDATPGLVRSAKSQVTRIPHAAYSNDLVYIDLT